MWKDPIVAEVRQVREAYAAKYNYNLHAIYQALKAQENCEVWEKVSFPPKPIRPVAPEALQLLPATLALAA